MTADELAQIIRIVDGNHDLGADRLAARIMEHWNTRAPSPWQDIATAPKDGTPVDLWSSRGHRYPYAVWGVVGYRPVGDSRPDACGWTDAEGHGSIEAGGPYTHWMPPPEPPK